MQWEPHGSGLSFDAQFMSAGLLARHEADIVTGVAVLEHLRAGQAEDATQLLETLLDGDLIGAAALVREGNKINLNARRAVEKGRLARTVAGYEPTDESVRAAAQDVRACPGQGTRPGTPMRGFHSTIPPYARYDFFVFVYAAHWSGCL